MSDGFSIIKPTLNTRYYIDFNWWKTHDNNWRVFLKECLCAEHKELYAQSDDDTQIDTIDPETAEVVLIDGVQHVLINHCAQQPDFLTNNTTLVDAVFKILLAQGNKPLTIMDISKIIDRPAETILRTLSGRQIYKGIMPYPKES